MMAHNLCYTTLLKDKKEAEKFDKDEVTITPDKNYFVKSTIKRGIFPIILDELISARK